MGISKLAAEMHQSPAAGAPAQGAAEGVRSKTANPGEEQGVEKAT